MYGGHLTQATEPHPIILHDYIIEVIPNLVQLCFPFHFLHLFYVQILLLLYAIQSEMQLQCKILSCHNSRDAITM